MSNALSPAKVNRVIIDEENNYATIIVPDDQLSLAIGKEGQNARLARLTGWHIDIKSSSFAGEPLVADEDLIDVEEVEEETNDGLCAMSIPTACVAAIMRVRVVRTAAFTQSLRITKAHGKAGKWRSARNNAPASNAGKLAKRRAHPHRAHS